MRVRAGNVNTAAARGFPLPVGEGLRVRATFEKSPPPSGGKRSLTGQGGGWNGGPRFPSPRGRGIKGEGYLLKERADLKVGPYVIATGGEGCSKRGGPRFPSPRGRGIKGEGYLLKERADLKVGPYVSANDG